MKGDGHIKNGIYKSYVTISKRLAEDIQELGIKLGYGTKVSMETSEQRKEYMKNKPKWCDFNYSDIYTVGFATLQKNAKNNKIEVIDYDDYVWDITVPNHIFFVRRNGKVAVSGNCYDGDPDNGGVRVYSKDHTFTDSEIYLQNGLIRIVLDEYTLGALKTYAYIGGAWILAIDRFRYRLRTSGQDLVYGYLKRINYVSPEKIECVIRLIDSATENEDYFVDLKLTMMRGSLIFKTEFINVYPIESVLVESHPAPNLRFGYIGDNAISDVDLVIGCTNTTLTDNFMTSFDDDGIALLLNLFTNQKPNDGGFDRFGATNASYCFIADVDETDASTTIIYYGVSPFSNISNLFKEAEDATISASAREYIDAEHWGFTDDSDMVTDAQPESGVSEIDGDNPAFWSNVANTTISDETTIVKVGSHSTKIVVAGDAGSFEHDYGAGNGQDFSTKDYVGFWWYGDNSDDVITLRFYDDAGGGAFYYDEFTVNFTGWKWICLARADFTDSGGADWTDIRIIRFTGIADGSTYYLDGLVVPYDGLWSDDADCTATINDETDPQTGEYNVKVYADNSAWNEADITPISAIGNLLKFDKLKFYAWRSAVGDLSALRIYLFDADGDSIYHGIGESETPTQFELDIPHQDSDLAGYGWTEVGTFDYSTFTYMRFTWNANAGETLYIDDLHFYIGTTTTRGRGETLSGGEAVVLDAQNEYCDMRGTDAIPEARYLVVYRAKDTDQVVSDGKLQIYNNNDTKHLNKENAIQYETLTSSFASYIRVFDISSGESGDLIRRIFTKALATENTIFIDYFLIVPISDGMNLPMDLAHGALYDINTETPVDIDSLKTDYIGIKL